MQGAKGLGRWGGRRWVLWCGWRRGTNPPTPCSSVWMPPQAFSCTRALLTTDGLFSGRGER